jgi:hypothetical protein
MAIDHFKEIVKATFEKETTFDYKPRFSASAFPYCARRQWIYETFPKERLPKDNYNFRSDFYKEVGNTIHKIIQKYLGIAGLLYGNWVCKNKYKDCNYYVDNHIGTPICKFCNNPMEYKELQLNRNIFGMGGYVDGIVPSESAILEIKSKSNNQINQMIDPVFIEWAYQASSYVTAVNRQYNMNLENVIMLYISRDNPENFKIFKKKALLNVLDQQIQSRKDGEQLIKQGKEPEFLCPDYDAAKEFYCICSDLCFPTDAKISKLPKCKRI